MRSCHAKSPAHEWKYREAESFRLDSKKPSRLAGDRDAAGGGVGIEGDMTPWVPACTRVLPVTAGPSAWNCKSIKNVSYPFCVVSKDLQDFGNIIRLIIRAMELCIPQIEPTFFLCAWRAHVRVDLVIGTWCKTWNFADQ